MTPDSEALIFLNQVPCLGPVRLHKLMEKWPSPQGILSLRETEMRDAGISAELARVWSAAFRDSKIRLRIDGEIEQWNRDEFAIVTEADPDYPDCLKNFSDRPPVLYVRGRWPLKERAVALVGTRRASRYGLEIAAEWGAILARTGIMTVSGLAAGIDAAAHRGTLEGEGHTVAVLAHGLQFQYPSANAALFKEIERKGTLLTEFGYGCPPTAGQFPRRNRIISGLSQAVVVIEAPIRSGAMITARNAAEQGREVLAVPGSIQGSQSSGCHALIQDGARLAVSVDDVLDSLGMKVSKHGTRLSKSDEAQTKVDALSGLEKSVWLQLEEGAISVDELMLLLQASFDRLANALLCLELKGLVRSLPGQLYARS